MDESELDDSDEIEESLDEDELMLLDDPLGNGPHP